LAVEHAHLLAEQVSASGPAIVVTIEEDPPPEGHVASQITAIMTEAVRNAVEHADASMIMIQGESRGDRGQLEIADNGHGISRNTPFGDHYGIVGMQERADDIGAKLSIDSARGRGTTIEIVWGSS
jgi:signal transduction histidine kinase